MDEEALLDELLEKIETPSVRRAFLFSLLALPRIPGISIEPERHGYMSSLRVRREAGWCFSIFPAKKWLLLYVRKPELARGRIDFEGLGAVFPDASERSDGELTVQVETVDSMKKFCELITRTV